MPLFFVKEIGVECVLLPTRLVSERRLSFSAKQVYFAFASLCTKAGALTATHAELAAEVQVGERAIRHGLKQLRALGYVIVVRRGRSAVSYFLPDMVMDGGVELAPATCRSCTAPTPFGAEWCSAWCAELHRFRTEPSARRRWVHQRDAGVCALCNLDTGAIENALRRLWRECVAGDGAATRLLVARMGELAGLGFNVRRFGGAATGTAYWWRSLWEADHVLAVVEGGGDCDLSNLRTLCVPCHKDATRQLRARLAASIGEGRP